MRNLNQWCLTYLEVNIMNRNDYLQMCRECAKLVKRWYGWDRPEIPDRLLVKLNGADYVPMSYTMDFEPRTGKVIHHVRLHDLYADSTMGADLESIEPKIPST